MSEKDMRRTSMLFGAPQDQSAFWDEQRALRIIPMGEPEPPTYGLGLWPWLAALIVVVTLSVVW